MEKEKATKIDNLTANTFVTQLRMADKLAGRLRNYIAKTGASINSTVCIAIDTWLKSINE